jgi:membrane-bound lytic murein transglycosylase D
MQEPELRVGSKNQSENQYRDSSVPSLKLSLQLNVPQQLNYEFNCITPVTERHLDNFVLYPPAFTAPNKTKYSLSLFQPSEIKKKAVKSLYKNYGYNRAVKSKLNFYSQKNKKTLLERLSCAGKYIEEMANIFTENGLPQELVFLPIIESGFNPYAYSRKSAAGPWQFIPATAKKYGLKIDWWIDERRDPVKSTLASSEYLKDLYERFGSWNLALAAYNTGEGRVASALKKVRKKDFWSIKRTRYIAQETKNYVPSFIATAAIAMDPDSFGLNDIDYQKPFQYDEVNIDVPMDLEVVARFTGVRASLIKELNPELRRWCTPPNVSNYILKIPPGTKEVFLANMSNAKDDELLYVKFYKVKNGDTVGKIARKLGASIQAIINMNSLGRKALIVAGKSLLIPIERNWDSISLRTGF